MRGFSLVIVFAWHWGETRVALPCVAVEYSTFLHFHETTALREE